METVDLLVDEEVKNEWMMQRKREGFLWSR